MAKIEVRPSRIHVREFLFTSGLTPMQEAGFRAYIGKLEWAYRDEWKDMLDAYQNR